MILCFGGRALRILGIDPGYATVGYGVVDYDKNRFKTVAFGAITTKAGLPFPKRLKDISVSYTHLRAHET